MRCQKRDGVGAMLRCDVNNAIATERCYDAMFKNAMAVKRCYDAMFKNAMALERCYEMRCQKRDGVGAMLRCDVNNAIETERWTAL